MKKQRNLCSEAFLLPVLPITSVGSHGSTSTSRTSRPAETAREEGGKEQRRLNSKRQECMITVVRRDPSDRLRRYLQARRHSLLTDADRPERVVFAPTTSRRDGTALRVGWVAIVSSVHEFANGSYESAGRWIVREHRPMARREHRQTVHPRAPSDGSSRARYRQHASHQIGLFAQPMQHREFASVQPSRARSLA